MPASLIVATILVAGWNVTVTVVALLTGRRFFKSRTQRTREMSQSLRRVRSEVGKPEIDARTNAWKRDGGLGTIGAVQSRISDTQWEVTRQVPYAEGLVVVVGEDGEETRRCSVCMN